MMVIRLFDDAPAVDAPQLAECPDCQGRGEISTGRHEHDTGAPVGRTCSSCSGVGRVRAEDVMVTGCCGVAQWRGTGCPDHDDTCPDHRPRGCRDCTDDGDFDADAYFYPRGGAA